MNIYESMNRAIEKKYEALKENALQSKRKPDTLTGKPGIQGLAPNSKLTEDITNISHSVLDEIKNDIKKQLPNSWYYQDRADVGLRQAFSWERSKFNLAVENDNNYHSFTKVQLQEIAKAVKALGGKGVTIAYGEVRFTLDPTPYIQADEEKRAAEKAAHDAELDAVEIEEWKPSKAVLDKLTAYMRRGSKVNVKAIKDVNKILTYYYAARLLGFNSLIEAITEEYYRSWGSNHADIRKELDAIDHKVAKGETDVPDQNFAERFSAIAKLLSDNGIKYSIKSRAPSSWEMEKDRYSGAIWTLAWDLIINPGTEEEKVIKIAEHTDEGDRPSHGYMVNERETSSKRDVAQRVADILNLI